MRLNLLVTVLWAGLCMLYVVSGPRDWRLAATAATTLIWALVTWLNVRAIGRLRRLPLRRYDPLAAVGQPGRAGSHRPLDHATYRASDDRWVGYRCQVAGPDHNHLRFGGADRLPRRPVRSRAATADSGCARCRVNLGHVVGSSASSHAATSWTPDLTTSRVPVDADAGVPPAIRTTANVTRPAHAGRS